jgi:hypothetical protein
MLPGFTASYSLFRTKHLYRGGSSSWAASETASRVVPADAVGPTHCITFPESCSITCITAGGNSQTSYPCFTNGGSCCPSPDGKTFTCCAYGQKCENGSCHWICDQGLTYCNGACVTCPVGGECSGTSCVCTEGRTNCNGTCVTCPVGGVCSGAACVCPEGFTDSNGTCERVCVPGFTNCNGTCVSLRANSNNCGACGHKCPPGMVCNFGFCESISESSSTTCDGNVCSTQTCTNINGECTGVNGPRSCIMVPGGGLQCCDSNIFFGENPWVTVCATCRSDPSGRCLTPPVSDNPQQGCGVCKL